MKLRVLSQRRISKSGLPIPSTVGQHDLLVVGSFAERVLDRFGMIFPEKKSVIIYYELIMFPLYVCMYIYILMCSFI